MAVSSVLLVVLCLLSEGKAAVNHNSLTTAETHLLHLFEKPFEPLDKPRGTKKLILSNRTREPEKWGKALSSQVLYTKNPAPTNLGPALSIPRGAPFSLYSKAHRRAAKDLIDLFRKSRGAEDLLEVAASVHDQVNEGLFAYALASTIIRNTELQHLPLPALVEMFPEWFVPQEQLFQAQMRANIQDPAHPGPIIIQHGPEFSGSSIKAEHRLSYWREDYGMNSHHYHWHLVHPYDSGVKRDRKGELFYYTHLQSLTRYDMERLSIGMNRVEKLENWRVPIPDGYFPKLTVNNAGIPWGSRQDNTLMQDMRRPETDMERVDVTVLEIWRTRLLDAIHLGFMIDREGKRVPLSDDVSSGKRGIDILADTFEADDELSVNYRYYGDLHNMGHLMIAVAHDPNSAHKEEMGVVGTSAVAMRDPVFYRWHKFVDDIFQQYKLTLPPYTLDDLEVADVKVESVGVVSGGRNNSLVTGWSVREFEASRGLDFSSVYPVFLRLLHLDHQPFDYHITVTNQKKSHMKVTVRIFLAPRENERGVNMTFMDQRLLWAEMDKFTYALKPGSNHIVRSSRESAITNPSEVTFRDLEDGLPGSPENAKFEHSMCGWPQHLLLPRGKPEGMTFQLFVMITDFEKDKVVQSVRRSKLRDGMSFCGILDAKYPDRRPMGFPFDRRPPPRLRDQHIRSAEDLAKSLGNILMQNITISFTDTLLEK